MPSLHLPSARRLSALTLADTRSRMALTSRLRLVYPGLLHLHARARGRRSIARAFASWAALAAISCAPDRPPVDLRGALHNVDHDAFISGRVSGLGSPAVLNRRDFAYALAFTRDASTLAFVHHVSKDIELTAVALEGNAPLAHTALNPAEFDVEDVAFVERDARTALVLPSRQGIARRLDARTARVVDQLVLGEPLTRVAVSPKGDLLAFGTAEGRVLLVDGTTFAFRGTAKPHEDEVQGLAFLDDTTLASVSFDSALVVSSVVAGPRDVVHVPSAALPTGERVSLAHIDGRRALAMTRDARQHISVVTAAAVKRLGLAPASRSVSVSGPAGPTEVPAVVIGELQVRGIIIGGIAAGVCDACVPKGAEIAVGSDVLEQVSFSDDVAHDDVIAAPKGADARFIDGLLALHEERRIVLPGPATDLDVGAGRKRAVVAYSATRAVRTYDVNNAEKKGVWPAVSESSGAVLVDLDTGALGRKLVGHQGFTVTASISPDGQTVATGGWDRRVLVFDAVTGDVVTERSMAWLVRRVRFAPDGMRLAVAAWTPASAVGDGDSEPSLVVYPLAYDAPQVVRR